MTRHIGHSTLASTNGGWSARPPETGEAGPLRRWLEALLGFGVRPSPAAVLDAHARLCECSELATIERDLRRHWSVPAPADPPNPFPPSAHDLASARD